MKINNNFFGMNITAAGLSVQRKKMNLISENIANSATTKAEDGKPYQRKFLVVKQKAVNTDLNTGAENISLKLNVSREEHMTQFNDVFNEQVEDSAKIDSTVAKDSKVGDVVYMPDHPDADENGYVQMPNVNIVTEMVDMISATRSYEANLTAFNSSKQMAKDTLEI